MGISYKFACTLSKRMHRLRCLTSKSTVFYASQSLRVFVHFVSKVSQERWPISSMAFAHPRTLTSVPSCWDNCVNARGFVSLCLYTSAVQTPGDELVAPCQTDRFQGEQEPNVGLPSAKEEMLNLASAMWKGAGTTCWEPHCSGKGESLLLTVLPDRDTVAHVVTCLLNILTGWGLDVMTVVHIHNSHTERF